MKKIVIIGAFALVLGFVLRECNRLFICHKAHYAEGVNVCFDGRSNDSVWYEVEVARGELHGGVIRLDSNQCFRASYYEETLGDYDIPTLSDFMERNVVLMSRSDTVRVRPRSVSNTDIGYLLNLPKIKVQGSAGGRSEFFVGGLSEKQYSKELFWDNALSLTHLSMFCVAVAVFLIGFLNVFWLYKWYNLALKRIRFGLVPNALEYDTLFTEAEESALQDVRGVHDSELVLKSLLCDRIRYSVIDLGGIRSSIRGIMGGKR